MQDDYEDDLTADEKEALAALPDEAIPPPELEERVVAGLVAQGVIRRGAGWPKIAATAALFLAAIALAYFSGLRAGASQAPDAGPPGSGQGQTFALLVYDPVAGLPPAQLQAAIADATAWAGELADAGVLTSAEKLRDEGRRLAVRGGDVQLAADFPPSDASLVLGGFFVIRAEDYNEAQRIAADCPLLRYGSIIEIRAFEEL